MLLCTKCQVALTVVVPLPFNVVYHILEEVCSLRCCAEGTLIADMGEVDVEVVVGGLVVDERTHLTC